MYYQTHQGKESLEKLLLLHIKSFQNSYYEITKQYFLKAILNISLHLEDY